MKWFLSGALVLALILGAALPAQAQDTSEKVDGWTLLPQVFGGAMGTVGGMFVGGIGGGVMGATSCHGLPSEQEDIESMREVILVAKCVYNVLTSTLTGIAIGMPAGAAIGVSLATPSDNFFQTYMGSFLGAAAGEALGIGALFVVPALFDMSWVDAIRHGDGFIGFTIMATIAGAVIGSYFN